MTPEDLVIVGVGGMAREARQVIDDINSDGRRWNILGFLEDGSDRAGSLVDELPVLGGREWLIPRSNVAVVLGIGKSSDRKAFDGWIAARAGNEVATLIHPSADVGARVGVGAGSIICQEVVLTTDARLGRCVIANVSSTLAHDDVVADYVTIAPGVHVAGAVHLDEGADLGIGCTINQGLTVGRWSIIGAGAAVVQDVLPNSTVVGVPAKEIKQRPDGWHEVGT